MGAEGEGLRRLTREPATNWSRSRWPARSRASTSRWPPASRCSRPSGSRRGEPRAHSRANRAPAPRSAIMRGSVASGPGAVIVPNSLPHQHFSGGIIRKETSSMRHYEIVFLVHPDQSEQVPAMIERYRGMHHCRRRCDPPSRGLGPPPARLPDRQGAQGALRADEHRDATRRRSMSSPGASASAMP